MAIRVSEKLQQLHSSGKYEPFGSVVAWTGMKGPESLVNPKIRYGPSLPIGFLHSLKWKHLITAQQPVKFQLFQDL